MRCAILNELFHWCGVCRCRLRIRQRLPLLTKQIKHFTKQKKRQSPVRSEIRRKATNTALFTVITASSNHLASVLAFKQHIFRPFGVLCSSIAGTVFDFTLFNDGRRKAFCSSCGISPQDQHSKTANVNSLFNWTRSSSDPVTAFQTGNHSPYH